MKADFEAGVGQLSDWLAQNSHSLSTKYRQKLHDARFDILTCGSLEKGDMKDLTIAPQDRSDLSKLLTKASLSAGQELQAPLVSNAEPMRLAPEQQQRVLEQVLEENRTLAARLKQQHKQEQDLPNELLCPTTMDLMADPVLAEDGIVYDREAIVTWLKQTGISPMTRKAIGNEFKPVLVLKSLIDTLQRQQVQ
eukprot:TRINITY_DN12664_c4_g1_i17.p2 TRINITY_DN12664_c4_g1~~TRINITY_DN12664_c4_g1_i17.p2  ORF type:complete len:194 (+),score=52.98 TRINITY_DN12664_c4_g1_i17:1249-1830(+)